MCKLQSENTPSFITCSKFDVSNYRFLLLISFLNKLIYKFLLNFFLQNLISLLRGAIQIIFFSQLLILIHILR